MLFRSTTAWRVYGAEDDAVFDNEEDAQAAADEYNDYLFGEMKAEARSRLRREARQQAEKNLEPSFEEYTNSGGENYRELLITIPTASQPTGSRAANLKPFTGAHWARENIVAHARVKTRVDASGAKVLFIEEVQSDWHQQGRDRGYADATPEQIMDAARAVDTANGAYSEAVLGVAKKVAALLDEAAVFWEAQRVALGDAPSLTVGYIADQINSAKNRKAALVNAEAGASRHVTLTRDRKSVV